MKAAIIDMGTNTFHLLIAEVNHGSHRLLLRERRSVKIGEEGINEGYITSIAKERAIHALVEFKAFLDEHEVSKTLAMATSAVRNARNGQELVREIREATGIEVKVISGLEEAEIIFKGVQKALDLGEEKNLIMDIGGGSIEFILADRNTAYSMKSFEIGGQRLMEKFHRSDPIHPRELENLNACLDAQLGDYLRSCTQFNPTTLVGSSGTFDTLSDIFVMQMGLRQEENATEFALTVDGFDRIYQDLIKKTKAERLAIPGMAAIRVDMIVVACALIRYVLDTLTLKKIKVSSYALKEGVLMQLIDTARDAPNPQ